MTHPCPSVHATALFVFVAVLVAAMYSSSAAAASHFSRRNASLPNTNEYLIEMPVVVDSLGVEKWKDIAGSTNFSKVMEQIESFLGEMAEMYTTLERFGDELKIRFVIPEVILYEGQLLSSDKIDGQDALDEFQRWLKNDYRQNYDMAFLYTGAELTGYQGRTGTFGYANIGHICQESSVFVQEVSGSYRDIISAAHEAGHVLGAYHDGHKNASECADTPIATTVMASGVSGKSPKHFFFSSCSYNAILETVRRQGDCLKDGNMSQVFQTDKRPGYFLSADQMCQRELGTWSYYNRALHSTWSHFNICVTLHCYDRTRPTMRFKRIATHQGMACGKNKECIQGKCVPTQDDRYSHLSETCPLGDQPIVHIKEHAVTCSELTPSICSSSPLTCCQACQNSLK